MADVNYGELTTNPKAMLDLMDNALIMTGKLKNSTVYGRPQMLKLVPDRVFRAYRKRRVRKNKTLEVLYLMHADGSPGFPSYILDYEKGQVSYQVLDREANYCFTITMNGCTFGIGSPTPDGSVLVTHSNAHGNLEGGGEGVSQAMRQRALARAFHRPNVSLFEPDSYRKGNRNVTTFGIRTKGAWQFYYQAYESAGGGSFRVYEAKKVKLTQFKG